MSIGSTHRPTPSLDDLLGPISEGDGMEHNNYDAGACVASVTYMFCSVTLELNMMLGACVASVIYMCCSVTLELNMMLGACVASVVNGNTLLTRT